MTASSTVGSGTRTGWKRRSGGVLLDVLAVLIDGGGTDALELTAREGGLEDVGGADGASAPRR